MRFGRRGVRLARLAEGAKVSGVGAQLALEKTTAQREFTMAVRLLYQGGHFPAFETNAKPFLGRDFELDVAFPDYRVGVEVQGGIWRRGGGAHSRPANIERDIRKAQLALMYGWVIVPVTTAQVSAGFALSIVGNVLHQRGFKSWLPVDPLGLITLKLRKRRSSRKAATLRGNPRVTRRGARQ